MPEKKKTNQSLDDKLQHILAECITHGFNDANSGLSEPTEFCRVFAHRKLKEIKELINVSDLRQWLNEDRITDPKKMVTNEQIEIMLGFKDSKTLE